MTHLKQNLRPTRDPGLVTIAIFKLFKGVSLIALGLGAILYGSLFTVEGGRSLEGKALGRVPDGDRDEHADCLRAV
jgi:hypothetical protein